MRTRLDFSLVRILGENCVAVDGGNALALTAYVAQVDGDRLVEHAAVARVTEVFSGWDPEDYQRANLKLHRALAARVAELALAARREEG